MNEDRKYAFRWDLLGDIELGRPNLGNTTRIEMYRLMQYTFRDIIEQNVGALQTDRIMFEAGRLAGKEFYSHMMEPSATYQDFASQFQTILRDMGVGILRIENIDLETGEAVFTIAEDLDCSGLPESGDEICTYDEGFISAVLEGYTGRKFTVREIDCWCTGSRTCRFEAKAEQE